VISELIWSKVGAEHDALLVADRQPKDGTYALSDNRRDILLGPARV